MDWEERYADRMGWVRSLEIMDLIRLMSQRPLINFAAGLPDPAGFPVEALKDAADEVLTDDWRSALQYSEPEGYRPLRDWVAADLTRRGVPTSTDQVLIVSGSQQGIDLVARAFLQPGSVLLTEDPTYLSALPIFRSFGVEMSPLAMDDGGLDPDAAGAAMRQPGVKLLYTMANHHNPSGTTLSDDRRRPLLEHAAETGVPILVDEAYLDLRYEPGEPAPLAAAAPEIPILTVGTFSKTVAPAMRVAWLAGPAPVIERIGILKQLTDLHANPFTQRVVHRFLSAGHLPAQVDRLRSLYRGKRDVFLRALERNFGGRATWSRPAGGMFLMLRLPPEQSGTALLEKALEHGVAYVPGSLFYPSGDGENTMRLCFVSASAADIDEGVARLAQVVWS
ncbi:MAG: PLP-dependent aminotransferase family protein [Myxococcales bacterium]|nr:PLP-dependent aminotransferase family protein [Myxococcales bacterium]